MTFVALWGTSQESNDDDDDDDEAHREHSTYESRCHLQLFLFWLNELQKTSAVTLTG